MLSWCLQIHILKHVHETHHLHSRHLYRNQRVAIHCPLFLSIGHHQQYILTHMFWSMQSLRKQLNSPSYNYLASSIFRIFITLWCRNNVNPTTLLQFLTLGSNILCVQMTPFLSFKHTCCGTQSIENWNALQGIWPMCIVFFFWPCMDAYNKQFPKDRDLRVL